MLYQCNKLISVIIDQEMFLIFRIFKSILDITDKYN